MPYLVYNPQNVLKTKIISASSIYWDVKTVKNIVSHKGKVWEPIELIKDENPSRKHIPPWKEELLERRGWNLIKSDIS